MKYYKLENYKNFKQLNEVGEGNLKPYDIIRVVDLNFSYTDTKCFLFDTDSGLHYTLNLQRHSPMSADMLLGEESILDCELVDDEDIDDFYNKILAISYFDYDDIPENFNLNTLMKSYMNENDSRILNNREQYRVLSTIKSILSKYLNENPEIKYLFVGGQETYGKSKSKKQRENFYLSYIKKVYPNAEICDIYSIFKEEYYPIAKIK